MIAYIIAYFAVGVVMLFCACAIDDTAETKFLNTPAKRLLMWFFWGRVIPLFFVGFILFCLYKLIREGFDCLL